jgi:hypothetical protein
MNKLTIPSAAGTPTASPTSTPEFTISLQTSGFRMVSDGNYIYYSQYSEPGLRKIRRDLSEEVLLADEDCTYLNLAGETLYYIVPDSGIWSMKTDGSDRKQLEMAHDASGLSYENGALYYIQNYTLYQLKLGGIETPAAELEEEYGAAAAAGSSDQVYSERFSEDTVNSLAAGGGHLFYTTSGGEEDDLYMLDPLTGESSKIASGVRSDIFVYDGRIYFEEEDKLPDLDVNTRICSLDLSGRDRIQYFEEVNAGGYFSVSDGYLLFTRIHTGGENNFDGSYLYRMDLASRDLIPLFPDLDVSTTLISAGGYVWFDHFSYDTLITSDYWGTMDGKKVGMIAKLRPLETKRSAYLDPYVEPYGPGESYLSLSTDDLSACFKLFKMDGTKEFEEFLDPNSQKVVSFPSGRYTLKIAEGTEWLGDSEAFGEDGHYSTTDVYKFADGYTYEIVSGTTGNFAEDNLNGFLDGQ